MDIITQRFIAIGKKLIGELRHLSGILQQHENAIRKANQANNQQDGPPPEVRAVLYAPQGVETRKSTDDAQADQRHHDQILLVQWVLCLATIGAFGAAAYYAHFARLQYYEMRESNRQSKEALKETLAKLQRQVNAANTANTNAATANTDTKKIGDAANRISNEALISLQRAFIFPGDTDATVVDVPGGPAISFAFKWGNSGASPTRDMKTHVSYQWMPGKLPDDFTFPDLWEPGAPHINITAMVGPKGVTRTSAGPIAMGIINAAESGKVNLYFWGWAKYRDVFKGTPLHVTEFCYEWFPVNKQIPPEEVKPGKTFISFEFHNCDRHNCADEECKKGK